MNKQGSHIINKVFLEVNTVSEEKATRIKNNVSDFLQNNVFPALEDLFDDWDNGQIVRFDKIDIDLNVKEWSNNDALKHELVKKIMLKIDDAKASSIKKTSTKKTLDKLLVDSEKSWKDLPRDSAKLMKEIEEERLNLLPEERAKLEHGHKIIGQQQNYKSTFLFFLENGYVPWFGKPEYITVLTKPQNWPTNLAQEEFLSLLKILFHKSKIAVKRFVLQFTDEQVLSVVESLKTVQIKDKAKLLSFIANLTLDQRNLCLNLIINIALNITEYRKELVELVRLQMLEIDVQEMTEKLVADCNLDFLSSVQHCFAAETISKYFRLSYDEIQQIVRGIVTENVLAGTQLRVGLKDPEKTNVENRPTIFSHEFVNSGREKESPFFEKSNTEIVVQNAGLVLFHPFLNTFFSHFGWINKKGQINDEYRIKAVQALHYCATGSEYFFEGNLLLEKFLCNIPLATPLPIESLLNEQVKIEADAMLKQLITHWPALKSTSPDGLREMFIHRNGKLIQKQKGYKLIVERKVQDILLDRLQWGISIVKLPWKDDLLFVEW